MVIAALAAAGRKNSTRRIKREGWIDLSVPPYPAILGKSADLTDFKGLLKQGNAESYQKKKSGSYVPHTE